MLSNHKKLTFINIHSGTFMFLFALIWTFKNEFLAFFGCKTLLSSKTPEANQLVYSRALRRVPTCILTFRTPPPLFLGWGWGWGYPPVALNFWFDQVWFKTKSMSKVHSFCFLHWFWHSKTCFWYCLAANPQIPAKSRRQINLFFQELSVEYPHVFWLFGPPHCS